MLTQSHCDQIFLEISFPEFLFQFSSQSYSTSNTHKVVKTEFLDVFDRAAANRTNYYRKGILINYPEESQINT